jgi:hypothetical protein
MDGRIDPRYLSPQEQMKCGSPFGVTWITHHGRVYRDVTLAYSIECAWGGRHIFRELAIPLGRVG